MLTMRDVKFFYDCFYKTSDKITQDNFILKHCNVSNPKRSRKRKEVNNKPKSITVTYNVKRRDGLLVNVCRQSFMSILDVKKDRILNLLKKYKDHNEMPKERRGGDRQKGKNDVKRTAIKNFVESLKCVESHYCRSKSFNRFYLPADLSIRKLWKMYNNTMGRDLQVKESFFRYFLVRKYNFGFGTPKTDICSTCLLFKEKFKKTFDANIKNQLMIQQRVHKLRANSFYEFLQREDPEIEIFSFDCQKNLALPKIPDQSAYFSMQVNFYHFAIIHGTSKEKINPASVRSYVWTELDHQRGSNEISSAVYHTLTNFEFNDRTKIIRLFCDGCGAQNKNSVLIGMLSHWLLQLSPPTIEKVEVFFPVVGHSYIPPDRLFGQIERIIKRTPEITNPGQYRDILQKWGTVYKLGVDVPILDWKTEVQKVMKQPAQWHFKFQMSKRIIMSKGQNGVLVSGELFYKNNTGTHQTLLRRGKKLRITPSVANIGVPIKKDKQVSITKLLQKHFGEDWQQEESLSFFKNVFDRSTAVENANPTPAQPLVEVEVGENSQVFCLEESLNFDI